MLPSPCRWWVVCEVHVDEDFQGPLALHPPDTPRRQGGQHRRDPDQDRPDRPPTPERSGPDRLVGHDDLPLGDADARPRAAPATRDAASQHESDDYTAGRRRRSTRRPGRAEASRRVLKPGSGRRRVGRAARPRPPAPVARGRPSGSPPGRLSASRPATARAVPEDGEMLAGEFMHLHAPGRQASPAELRVNVEQRGIEQRVAHPIAVGQGEEGDPARVGAQVIPGRGLAEQMPQPDLIGEDLRRGFLGCPQAPTEVQPEIADPLPELLADVAGTEPGGTLCR